MGFFSQQCHGCHLSILADAGLHWRLRWLNAAVAIQHGGTVHAGYYDGYGRLFPCDSAELAALDERTEDDWNAIEADEYSDAARSVGCTYDDRHEGPTVWHHACWLAAGAPREYQGESPDAPDQGYFFELADYETRLRPKSPAGLARLRASVDARLAKRQRELEQQMAKYRNR